MQGILTPFAPEGQPTSQATTLLYRLPPAFAKEKDCESLEKFLAFGGGFEGLL